MTVCADMNPGIRGGIGAASLRPYWRNINLYISDDLSRSNAGDQTMDEDEPFDSVIPQMSLPLLKGANIYTRR